MTTGILNDKTAEAVMARLINDSINRAAAADRIIDTTTARRIAACLHRGLGGELERFAGTGRINNVQVARLELFYSARGEQLFTVWRSALRIYLKQFGHSRELDLSEGSFKPITPPPTGMTCDPAAAVAYVCTHRGDKVRQPGLALQMQDFACREFARHHLRQHMETVFADQPDSHQRGLHGLLAHLAVCHNHRVIVHRLDRLSPGSESARQIAKLGARVLSVTETNTRYLSEQSSLNVDATQFRDGGKVSR